MAPTTVICLFLAVLQLSTAAVVKRGGGKQRPHLADKCDCSLDVQKVSTNKSITFVVIGDWGRIGGNLSVTPASQGGYDASGWCSNPANGFAADDIQGGIDQHIVATAMEAQCKKSKCQFVIGTGDSFYECGLDNPKRWKTDFEDIYQSAMTPTLKELKWYNVMGNHDIVADGSVDAQIAYGQVNKKWVANRSYGFEVHSKDGHIRLRFAAVSTSPFVTKYGKPDYKYNTSEFRAYASPAKLTEQLTAAAELFNSSHATHDFLLLHHPMLSWVSANGYNATMYNAVDKADMGRPAADGKGSWGELFDMVRTYKPVAALSGHDHSLSYAVDPEDPQLYTTGHICSGAGSLPDTACNTASYRDYLLFSPLATNNTACKLGATGPNYPFPGSATDPRGSLGFVIITVTAKKTKADFHVVGDNGKSTKAYTAELTSHNLDRKPNGRCKC